MKLLRGCLGLSALLVFAGARPALAEAAGERWLECFVGKGGQATPEAVLDAARAALDKGDGEALRALAPDRCASFRAGELESFDIITTASALARDDGLVAFASDIKARLFFEELQLALLPIDPIRPPAEGWRSMPLVRISTLDTQRVQVVVDVVSIDDRWYLWSRPRVFASGDRVVSRFRTLTTELSAALRKHKTPKPALRAIDGWWKKRGPELARLLQATRTLEGSSDRAEVATLRRALADSLGPLAKDDQIASRLASLLPTSGRARIGVQSCDDYIDKILRCAEQMPDAAGVAMSDAMAQVIDAWTTAAATPDGRDAMQSACTSATEAASNAMSTMCPGVF